MKVAVVGSRDYPNLQQVRDYIFSLPRDTVIVSGGARGVDQMAEHCARLRNMTVEIFLPDWKRYGKSAGMIRNGEIVAACDEMAAFWHNKSKGTANTIERARQAGKRVTVFEAFK